MHLSRRLTLLAATCAVAVAVTPGIALAHGQGHGTGDETLLRSGLVGSTKPAEGGATIFGVAPGGANWVVDEGSVKVRRDGRINLSVEGLVIPTPPQNGTNPIESLTASVYCNGAVADTTALFPLSVPDGDGHVRADLTLPDTCVAPVVLLHPRGNLTVYIAASGG
jgi:hypothetical protein